MLFCIAHAGSSAHSLAMQFDDYFETLSNIVAKLSFGNSKVKNGP